MKLLQKIILISLGSFSLSALMSAQADIIISEVDSAGSGTSSYKADWFELTNTGSSAVNISGWSMDDSSNSFSDAVALNGVSSIAAGQSVVFIESTGTTAASVESKFEAAWFGSNVPTGFTIGDYSGGGVGLSQSGDSVNIFTSTGTLVTRVDFDAPVGSATFDNSAGLNNVTLTTASVAGKNGAFNSLTSSEIGSPGVVPEPGTCILMIGGFAMLIGFQILRRNKIA